MKTLKLKLDQIKPASWNPEHRSEPAYCADLVASFSRIGKQLIPCVVSDNKDGTYTLVEGHRRVTACRVLGWDVECTVCSQEDAATYYSEINSTMKRLDGKDKLHVYLSKPEALDISSRKECEKWNPETLRYMADHGAGIATFKQGRTVANFAGTDPEKTVRWLARYSLTYTIRRAIEDGTSPATIAAAIESDRALKHQGWA